MTLKLLILLVVLKGTSACQNCIRKCCQEEHILYKRSCVKSLKDQLVFPVYEGMRPVSEKVLFDRVYGRGCEGVRPLKLNPGLLPGDVYYVQKNGSLFMPVAATFIPYTDYCMEVFKFKNKTEVAPLVCIKNVVEDPSVVFSFGSGGRIRKCCPEGQKMVSATVCVPTDLVLDVGVYNESVLVERANLSGFQVVFDSYCRHQNTLLVPNFTDPTYPDNFYVQASGALYLPDFNDAPTFYAPDRYCVDFFRTEGSVRDDINVLLCFDASNEISLEGSLGMIISIPFLLATFIAYALLPDRNLHMKALMFYVVSLMISYIILVTIQLTNSRFADLTCAVLAYLCIFFFLVSFFWMNVICIDIWFAFSGLRGFSGSKKTAERKRFVLYCIYACLVPVLHILIIYLIDRMANTRAWYHPGMGSGQCFLRKGYPELLYFHGPMALIITANITFFAVTAFKIRAIKKDTSMLKKEDSKKHSYENDKQNFNLYLKLLFAMGVNWSMEIISWAVNWLGDAPAAVWYVTDFCNAIYGVFIFFIFVFKKNIWKLLKKRYYSFIGKPHLAHSMRATNTTRVTSYSTATASITENPHGVNDSTTLTSEA